MKNIYINIARKLDQTALSFMVGLLSGWLINLVTGTLANIWFIFASIFVFLCVVSNFGLQLINNAIREHIDSEYKQEEFNRARPHYQPKSIEDIKSKAYSYKPHWQNKFLFSFFVGAISFILSIIFVIIGNVHIQHDTNQQLAQQHEIKVKVDSMLEWHTHDQFTLSKISITLDSLQSHTNKREQETSTTAKPNDTSSHKK